MGQTMDSLIHLIYASAATVPFDRAELDQLLATARRHNAAVGVSGMLLYLDGSFFQVLEGDEAAVERLYDHIAKDRRHAQITKIIREPIAERTFAEWTMGFGDVDARDLRTIDGLNDFFRGGSCLHQLDNGRARKLLDAFAKGRWRVRLSDDSAAQRGQTGKLAS